ncbi:GNAT family N-acetyltransferase [Candidatus Heimdallarchaeota archaeon]|nr:MAG: GNAT family N-acetyltransferase [Candidatus Heimdallarchaeota archaeon]
MLKYRHGELMLSIEKLQIDNEKLNVRPWNFEEDVERVSKLLEIVFEEELESKGLEAKAIFDEYKSISPLLKIMSLFNKNYKHALDGFIVENLKREIIASVNIGYGIYHWEIAMVATHPDYRRKGLARKLVTKAINHAKELGAKICVLEVKDINEPAYKLYQSLGFIHYDSISRYKLEHDKLSEVVSIEIPEGYEIKELERNKKTREERYQLDLRHTPKKTQEFHPIDKKRYHKPLLIRIIRLFVKFFIKMKHTHWIVHHNDILVSSLNVTLAHKEGTLNRIELMLDPEYRAILTKPLLNYALNFVKENSILQVNTIVELRASDEIFKSVCEESNFKILETMHLLGLKL